MTWNAARSLALAGLAASFALAACGTNETPNASSSAVTKPTESVRPGPENAAKDAHQRPGHQRGKIDQNAREAMEERARNAASGDPVGPRNTDIPEPEDYGFGRAAATAEGGEVVAYDPSLEGGRMIVPLTVENRGDKRASYTVTVTVKGKTDPSMTKTVSAKVTGLFKNTTWPTQVDVTGIGVTDVEDLVVTLKVAKTINRWQ
ncbi:hypothetical protein [Streptomyces milbemycinicus]|uniref:Lipoprotein n=1 Tax=Streptomyces milbemycinicus TaxID=476552 RepID=A0ABW8LY18_9ACTN